MRRNKLLKSADLAAIFIGIILVVGLSIVMPEYYRSYYQQQAALKKVSINIEPKKPTVIVPVFGINKDINLPNICNAIYSIINKHNLKGALFISGNLAEKYPKCISLFSSNENIDIGSQTYSYSNLTSIPDYTKQLNEVKNGKRVIDYVGKVDSKLFKAPYGSTDGNIYSLLSRSGILADFSYSNQYNKYENGQFIKYNIITYNPSSNQSNILSVLASSKGENVLINFDNSIPLDQIDSFISKLKSVNKNIKFASVSDITGMNLTIRKES